jgi:hypothetical protein
MEDNKDQEVFPRIKPPHKPEGFIQLLGLIASDSRYRRLSRFEQMQEMIEKYLAYQERKK